MLGRDFAKTTANIGLNAMQKAAIPQNQPNLGVMLAQGLNAWNEKKANEERASQLGAYSEALKELHPEDAARIDAMGALEAGAYYDALNAEEREQQNKLAYLAQQHQNALGLEALRNQHAIGLEQLRKNISNAAAQAERDRQAAAIEEALQKGYITPEQANMARVKMSLGDIAKGLYDDTGAGGTKAGDVVGGVELTGNPEYDKIVLKEKAKNDIKVVQAKEELERMKPIAMAAINRAYDATKSGSGLGPIGGRFESIGLNPWKNSNQNYADIKAANTQMNTLLRDYLKTVGITGKELDAAREAASYRYEISPTMPEGQAKRQLDNFVNDIINGGVSPEQLIQENNNSLQVGQKVGKGKFTVERIE